MIIKSRVVRACSAKSSRFPGYITEIDLIINMKIH